MTQQEVDKLVNKKVTCKIGTMVIEDAILVKEHGIYYLCQNLRTGSAPSDKKGYTSGWSLMASGKLNLEAANVCVTELKLLVTEPQQLPIFN